MALLASTIAFLTDLFRTFASATWVPLGAYIYNV